MFDPVLDGRVDNVHSKNTPTNPRGIPYAPFVDKVEDYVSSRAEVEGSLKSFQEMISYACSFNFSRRRGADRSRLQEVPVYASKH